MASLDSSWFSNVEIQACGDEWLGSFTQVVCAMGFPVIVSW